MRHLKTYLRIFKDPVNVADHFIDDAEHADNIRYLIREAYRWGIDVKLNRGPLNRNRQAHAQNGVRLGHERDAFRCRKEGAGKGDIFAEVCRSILDRNHRWIDAIRVRAISENVRLRHIPQMACPATGFAAQEQAWRD